MISGPANSERVGGLLQRVDVVGVGSNNAHSCIQL